MSVNESIVEEAALEWFGELGYTVGHAPLLAPGEPAAERDSFGDVVLVGRLRDAIARLNPAIPEEAREDALRKVLRVATPSLVQTNRAFHRLLRDGVAVEYPRPDGSIAGDHVRLLDFGTDDEIAFYDALAVNESAVQAMGDDKLKLIATALITQVRKSVTIDWTLRESARAKIRVMVKRILNKYGYPPDLQEEAVKTVLAQAELLCADWVS